MKHRFTPRAVSNINAISDYLHARNPAAAAKVRAAIYASIESLIDFPKIGHKQKTKNIRKWVVQNYPYLIYYAVNEAAGEITILNVKSQAERRPHDDA